MVDMTRADEFFAFARKRHWIWIKRRDGLPPPWTDDPILQTYRFTNVFRELDKTTVWFLENVREAVRDEPQVLLATVLFRWFNRISTCEVIFKQPDLSGRTGWEHFRDTGDTGPIKTAILAACPGGPWVTGAYMIRSPTGMNKLDGMLKLCRDFYRDSQWMQVAQNLLDGYGESEDQTVESFTKWLTKTPGMGPFLAYEVACDLIHTDLLCNAPDIMTWANPGPGAQRGLNRLSGRVRANPRKPRHVHRAPITEATALEEMRALLMLSLSDSNWSHNWPQWDMRTVEHTLCEFDKYERVRLGEGRPRGVFSGG